MELVTDDTNSFSCLMNETSNKSLGYEETLSFVGIPSEIILSRK